MLWNLFYFTMFTVVNSSFRSMLWWGLTRWGRNSPLYTGGVSRLTYPHCELKTHSAPESLTERFVSVPLIGSQAGWGHGGKAIGPTHLDLYVHPQEPPGLSYKSFIELNIIYDGIVCVFSEKNCESYFKMFFF